MALSRLLLRISVAVAILGILFKIMHWPYAALLLILGCISIAISYTLLFFNKRPKKILDCAKLALLIFFLFHYVFRIFHWSYGYIFTLLTQISLGVTLLLYIREVFFIKTKENNIHPQEKVKKRYKALSYLLYGIAAVGIIVGAQFKILHWEFNFINGDILLIIGLLAVIASLFIPSDTTEA